MNDIANLTADGYAPVYRRLEHPAPAICGIVPILDWLPAEYQFSAWRLLNDGLTHLADIALPHGAAIPLIAYHMDILQRQGVYEQTLFNVYTSVDNNHAQSATQLLVDLFHACDLNVLRALGEPVPEGPFTLYRGVSGRGRPRRVYGLSWTTSQGKAAWYSRRYRLPDPAVYRVQVDADQVIVCLHTHGEQEFIIWPPIGNKPVRVQP